MSSNENLHKAKITKNDEFYTKYEDVEAELSHYPQYFQNKLIYCNCDTDDSNFVKYFKNNNYNVINTSDDFRLLKNIELLKEADIIVTNPPWSLFREYIALLMEYDKKFLIIGNKNSITYKEVFPLLKDNKVWLGYNSIKTFKTPNGDTKQVSGLSRWFTNLDIKKRHEKMILYKTYDPQEYPKYDNFNIIDIGRVNTKGDRIGDVSLIPVDYTGLMGVPITFIDNYNPDQFELIGILHSSTDEEAGTPNLRYYNQFKEMRQDMSYTGAKGSKSNGNPVLMGRPYRGNFLYNPQTGEYVYSTYVRLVIKRKV